MIPKGVNLRADDRPVLDAGRGRRNGQTACAEFGRKASQAIDQANSEPGHWSDNDQEIDDRDDNSRQHRPTAESH